MFGCERAAAARASRSKRARSAVGASVLIATRRASSGSSASQTALIAPRPSVSRRRYRPAITRSALGGLSCSPLSGLPTIDEALARVLAHAAPLPAEEVHLRAAVGRVLAEDARAATDLPPFDSSAMDGYAVRAGDGPGALRVVAHSA